MLPFSPERTRAGLGAALEQPGVPRSFTAADTDSRRVAKGGLFVAVQGSTPGEGYFDAALAAGAGGLAGRAFKPSVRRAAKRRGAWLFRVRDGLAALQALAADQRRQMGGKVVALTGSNGKTGTKDLLAHLLAGEGEVLATQGNFNNHLGVPLTLLRARPGQRFAVLEAGMNHAGELLALGRLILPDLAVELNVGDAHAGFFKDGRRGVARAKQELLQAMGPGGIAVVNADDPYTVAMGRAFQGRVVSFGRSRGAALRLDAVDDRGAHGLTAWARWNAPLGGKPARLRVRLGRGGKAGWTQAAASLAAALALGCEPGALQRRLAGWAAPGKLRQELRPLPFGAKAILDAYNASPQSMQAGLDYLARSARGGRKLAVLGCMLELGALAPALHRALGRQARAAGVRSLVALGEHAQEITRGFGGDAAALGAAQAAEAAAWMRPRLAPGAWCLFKGSRGLAVERVYDALQGDR
jgi:UDP-N-acetylmuramoyl-tripeptide--D-alanyl-D-alanine ligase